MGCQSIAGLPPALNSPVPIYTPWWREAPWELSVLPKNTTQCPRPGLEPGALAPESSALTMRPPRLRIRDRHEFNSASKCQVSFCPAVQHACFLRRTASMLSNQNATISIRVHVLILLKVDCRFKTIRFIDKVVPSFFNIYNARQ